MCFKYYLLLKRLYYVAANYEQHLLFIEGPDKFLLNTENKDE
jgi:hypothetical protein